MVNAKHAVILASALLAGEAVAANAAHRHMHQHFHAKKDGIVALHTEYTTYTKWVTVTEDADAPKTFYKQGAHKSPHTEQYKAASTSPAAAPSPKPATKVEAPPAPQVPTTLSVAPAPAVPTPAKVPAPAAVDNSPAPGNKRGLAYNNGNFLAPLLAGGRCSWSYNWGQVKDGAAPSSLEYVPMLWGIEPDKVKTWKVNADTAIADGSKYLLSFNECDNAGQANLSPGVAADNHRALMGPYRGRAQISTPAITNSGSPGQGIDWLKQFLSACGPDCPYDFCAVHWYNGPYVSDFTNHLLQAHEVCGKKLWITEFATTGASIDQTHEFMKEVLYQLDHNSTFSFVERYSWFMVNTGSLLASTNSLSSYGNLYAHS